MFFVLSGTAANSFALATLRHSCDAILCHEWTPLETDECGAPEFFSHGAKLLPLPSPDGKITPEGVDVLCFGVTKNGLGVGEAVVFFKPEQAAGFAALPGVAFPVRRHGNVVFARLPGAVAAGLRSRGWRFHEFIGSGVHRFMCSWATTGSDVDALVTEVARLGRATAGDLPASSS